MAGNSFLIKGWSITIAAAFCAMATRDLHPSVAVLGFFPALAFWGLDAYYLRLERLFRKLYDDVRTAPDGELVDRIGLFSLRVEVYSDKVQSWVRTLFSASVIWLHLMILGSLAAIASWIHFTNR